MITTSDKLSVLEKIRDHYSDIKMITIHCCSDISPEAIPDMISQRAELMSLIAEEEHLLNEDPDGSESQETDKIRGEIRAIIDTIVTLDVQVEQIIKDHLQRVKRELALLSKSSKAVSAYTIQSRV